MRKTLSILLSLIMVFSVFTVIPVVSAGALDGIGYLDEDDAELSASIGITVNEGNSLTIYVRI